VLTRSTPHIPDLLRTSGERARAEISIAARPLWYAPRVVKSWRVEVAVVLVGACAALLLRCHREDAHDSTLAHVDQQQRRHQHIEHASASISGTVRDSARVAVAGARVCAFPTGEELPLSERRTLRCTQTNVRGAYSLVDVYITNYVVSASAPHYRPESLPSFALHAAESKSNVDITLRGGGVEITGTVLDVGGGTISHAQIDVFSGTTYEQAPTVETDDLGKFQAWVWPGNVGINARADGYTRAIEFGDAPGHFTITLTPASSLSGRVVDAATNAPVPDVVVSLSSFSEAMSDESSDTTDDAGMFHIEGLGPGRYAAHAVGDHSYGRSNGSVLVGLGKQVDDIVVKVYPAFTIEGKVMIAGTTPKPCAQPSLTLSRPGTRGMRNEREMAFAENEEPRQHSGSDGSVTVGGLLPGKYSANVGCDGYPSVSIEDIELFKGDVKGLTWTVTEGSTIRGTLRTSGGAPVADAEITAQGDDVGVAKTKPDGGFEITGLRPGNYWLSAKSDAGVEVGHRPKVTVGTQTISTQDLMLQSGGSIAGTVSDNDGKPVPQVKVICPTSVGEYGEARTNDDGGFRFANVTPGKVSVSVEVPGTSAKPQQVEVQPTQTAHVAFVVATRHQRIQGTVIDAAGLPVDDATVVARSEDDKRADETSVATAIDGSFTLNDLAETRYTVRAYRTGAGAGVVEHAQVGATLKLQLKPTGSIAGTVVAGTLPDELMLRIDDGSGTWRRESFYKTDGRYHVDDLPSGHYKVTANAGDGDGQITVDVADGAHVTDANISLDGTAQITGRVIDFGSKQPLVGASLRALLTDGHVVHTATTDDAGRFQLDQLPSGHVSVHLSSPENDDYDGVDLRRDISSGARIDLGDIIMVRRRYKPDDKVGRIGVQFARDALRIASIDPGSPAAKSALVVGDVITSIDGMNVTGLDVETAASLLRVPLGTAIQLGLAREVTVTVVPALRE
jgi:Carboxypeptidase regulatory-like domain/PDZ domain